VFLLLGGGLLAYKMKGDDKPPPPPAPIASATTVARPALTDAPPPPVEEDAGTPAPDASATKVASTGGGPCGTTCSGSASGALQSEVQTIAGRARGCYERALRQNAQLQGKITVALKIDMAGNVCGASAANDSMGSPEVSSCVTGMFRGKKFSPPTGGCVNMTVPLNFTPKR
jgi:outer membrane biosynthesis protein TonB